ncbi:MAG TPA: cell division protein ZapD [Steroidobacteraceae bacterium]|nr:cell division protein ZapD [Steroidobacteraceae bacterium]
MQPMAPAEPEALAARRTVVFEQPLNERMRTFLRLEFLYQQALYHNDTPTSWSSRAAVTSLLEMLAITARGDARNDVLKDLERQMAVLRDFQSRPGVDTARLRAVLARLTQRRDELQATSSSALARLRDNEFLAAIKHRSTIPGGTCDFDLPDYFHWLNLPTETRQANFNTWLGTLRPLCESVGDLLWVTRENARPRREVAPGGTYQIVFERDTPIQLLRITLPGEGGLYPEISGSHHRCSIRFLSWVDPDNRPVQAPGDVPFVLTCCT